MPCAVFRRGEPRHARAHQKPQTNAQSGVNILVGRSRNLSGQIRQAECFLKQHRPALERLRRFPGVEHLCLDFGISQTDSVAHYDHLPPTLIRLAAQCGMGIEISHYATHC